MKNKYQDIQNTKANIDNLGVSWREKLFSHPERTIRLGTSFSGIGAIEHAFHKLGLKYKIQFAGDIDESCKLSYFANYDVDEDRWHSDIHDFNAKPYRGKIDLFVGGTPCQAFSIRGKRGGLEDTRGTLFNEFARVVIECQPKIFIFENVKGLLNHDKGHTWKTIKQTFEDDCGYDVYYQVLNGKDYGIPQNRERVYCIGFRKETDFKYPAPIALEQTIYDYLQESFDNKYILKERGVHFITLSINHAKSYTQINGDIMLCQKRNQQFNWHGDFIYHPIILRHVANVEEYIHTFHASDYEESYYINDTTLNYAVVPKGKERQQMIKVQESEVNLSQGVYRKLTPRECLRLMGFDDSFKIVVPDTATYKQSGNSIIVNVLIALLKQIDITQYGI
jgi:DNA (cytosine-5)-methyltransferase 1